MFDDVMGQVEGKLRELAAEEAPTLWPKIRRKAAQRRVELLLAELDRPPSPRGRMIRNMCYQLYEPTLKALTKGA